MKYYQSIPPSDRLADSTYARIFRFFFSEKLGSDSPLNAWVEWYCNQVLISRDSAAPWKLQETLTGRSDLLSRSFFVAACYGFCEIVTLCVTDPQLGVEDKDQGRLLAAIAAQNQIFDIISQDRGECAVTEPLLLHAVRAVDKERLAWLLDKSPDTIISGRVFAAVAGDPDDEKMTILLNKYPNILVTQRMFEVAIDNVSLTNFETLMARVAKPLFTEGMLWRLYSLKPIAAFMEKTMMLWDSIRESSLTPRLITEAMRFSDDPVLEVLLERAGAINITEGVVIFAAESDPDMFRLVLRKGGKVTDTVLDSMASFSGAATWHVVLEQGYEFSVNVERLKLAAGKSTAVLSLLLEHADDTISVHEMAGLVHEVASRGENDCIRLLLDYAKGVEVTQDMLWAAILNPNFDRSDTVKLFLDRLSEVQVSEDMLIAAARYLDGFKMTQMLLERRSKVEVSEYVLIAAACYDESLYHIIQLLLEQDIPIDITEDVLITALQFCSYDVVTNLLERSKVKATTACLLEAAVSNSSCGGELVRLLVRREKITKLPEAVLIQAVEKEMGILLVLEATFGHINLTEKLIAKCVQRATPNTIGFLLSRVDPVHMTEEVWMCALKNNNAWSEKVHRAVAEQFLHVSLTMEMLVFAAQHVRLNLFRFLWSRGRRSSVPEGLINAAAKNSNNNFIMEFLLHEADCVEVGEATLLAIMANRGLARECFDLLLDKGLQVDTTDDVPETLLINGGIEVNCSSPKSLQISKGMKVTEEVFRVAACNGDESVLDRLSRFCELENVPEKWLDVARLYRAATIGNDTLLRVLLGRGVNPNVTSPDGRTPLLAAASRGKKQQSNYCFLPAHCPMADPIWNALHCVSPLGTVT